MGGRIEHKLGRRWEELHATWRKPWRSSSRIRFFSPHLARTCSEEKLCLCWHSWTWYDFRFFKNIFHIKQFLCPINNAYEYKTFWNKDHSKMLASRSSPTAVYAALLNSQGECLLGMGDMTVHEEIGREYITQSKTLLEDAPIVILDANLSLDGISSILEICHGSGTPVWFEPTEIRKAEKICQVASPESLAAVSYMSPNLNELKSIVGAAPVTKSGVTPFDEISRDELSAEEQVALQNCFSMFPGLKMVLLTKGKQGIIVAFKDQEKDILGIFKLPSPSINSSDIVSVSGAGDCLNAGFISGILRGLSWNECARLGSDCAKQSLLTISNVPDKFVW